MLIRQEQVPPPFREFAHRQRYEWYRAEDERGLYAWLALAESGEDMEMHLEAVRWGPQTLRSMRTDIERVKEKARRRGKIRLLGFKAEQGTEPDPRWARFVGLFGFGGHAVIQTAALEL